MRKVNITIYVLLIIILLKISSTYILNESFITKYEKSTYDDGILRVLSVANIWQPYIVHYNKGNVLYKSGKYEEAIEEYKKALNLFPPQKRECSIRINLALAMIKNAESIENQTIDGLLQVLSDAKEVLYEDGCANKNNDGGHSKKAIQLKKDIENYEKLLKLQQQEQKKGDENNQNNKEEEVDKNVMNEKEQKIKEAQKQSSKSRQDRLLKSKNIKSDSYSYKGKSW